MTMKSKFTKLGPTELTWDEQNPSSYLFNSEVYFELRKTIEREKEKKNEKKRRVQQKKK